MARILVAVVFGGVGEEHPVAVRSAEQIARNLNLAKYEPLYVRIGVDGAWRTCAHPASDPDEPGVAVALVPDRAAPGLLLMEPAGPRLVRPDVVLPVLHGRFGEDGALQGLLELAGIPYAGCDPQSGMLAMDKSLTYLVAAAAGVAVPVHQVVAAGAEPVVPRRFPVFVKPARSGSSYGVARVEDEAGLATAVREARALDAKVLVEEAVVGREVGCAVLESDGRLLLGEVDEIRASGGFFRIHQEQAPQDNTAQVVPADIPSAARERIMRTARTVYRALGCRGLARVDMFLTADDGIVLGEVNTFPGMTAYSRYPRMMAAAGLPMPEVLDRLIAEAMRGSR